MSSTGRERMKLDSFQIRNRNLERAIVEGLTAAGYGVDITPDFELQDASGKMTPRGSTVTVYRKEAREVAHVKTIVCRYNDGVGCWKGANCQRCGWNPETERDRPARKEKTEEQAAVRKGGRREA